MLPMEIERRGPNPILFRILPSIQAPSNGYKTFDQSILWPKFIPSTDCELAMDFWGIFGLFDLEWTVRIQQAQTIQAKLGWDSNKEPKAPDFLLYLSHVHPKSQGKP